MKEDKNLDFLLLPVWLTDRLHLYSGPWRDIFSTIYNFSKDGKHAFRSPMEELAKVGHISERRASTIVNTLVAAGYITREQKKVISKGESAHAKYEYKANISELLDRLKAGEDIWPEPPKKDEIISPIIESEKDEIISPIFPQKDEIISPKGMKLFPKKDEIISGQYKELRRNTVSNYYSSACARQACSLQQEEKEEFYKIFFILNAADPAAEVAQFVTMNEDQNWTTPKTGHVFETPVERRSLAYRWGHNISTKRLVEGETTTKFYKFLEALYYLAKDRGGIVSQHILDTKSYYVKDDTVITWHGSIEVREWVQSLWADSIVPIKNKYFGEHMRLLYQAYDA